MNDYNDPPRPPSPAGRVGRAAAVTAVVIIAGMIAATVILYGLALQARSILGEAAQSLVPVTGPPTIETKAVIVSRLAGARELTTAVYTMETVVNETQDRTFGAIVVGRTRLLYVAHGRVRAGVDMTALRDQDVSVTPDGLRVNLPAPRIFEAALDVDRSYVYDLDRSLLGPVDPDLQSRAERYARARLQEAACESGILEQAAVEAERTVSALLDLAGHTGNTVTSRRASAVDCLAAEP